MYLSLLLDHTCNVTSRPPQVLATMTSLPWLTGPLNCKYKKLCLFWLVFINLAQTKTYQERGHLTWGIAFITLAYDHICGTFSTTTTTTNVYGCFACIYVCAPCVWLVSGKSKRRHQIPWYWSYRWLQDVPWVLGNEPGSSGRVAITPTHWNLSLVLGRIFS